MSGTAFRDALHEVASVGAGPMNDARLARVADRAKGGEQAPTAPRGGGRRRWVVGGLAVAAAAVLVVVGVAQVLRPVEVTPASGPGSLPDQIFPTREHILTMEQAPIGRVSLVFAGAWANGGPAWIAVGADTDEYRWVASAEADQWGREGLDVSPDGTELVIAGDGETAGSLGVEVLDTVSGVSRWIGLPDDGAGGSVESLRWNATGDRVGVQALVTNGDDPDKSSAHVRSFVVDVPTGSVDELPPPAAWADGLVGWTTDGQLLMGNDTRQGSKRQLVVRSAGIDGSQEVVGRVPLLIEGDSGVSAWSVSPDARLLAAIPDRTGDQTGVTENRRLVIWRLSDGKELARVPLGPVGVSTARVVGWKDATTPVISYFTGPHLNRARFTNTDYWGHVQSVPTDEGRVEEIATIEIGSDLSYYRTSRLAASVVSAGEVRDAQPPEQPWYDPRTLGPAMRDTLNGWLGNAAAQGLVLVVLVVGGLVLLTRRINRRRLREVHSRSSS
jgi:hypothetical protein